MLIRNYIESDIKTIEKLALKLHENYVFRLDDFSNCIVILNYNNIYGFITYSLIYDRVEIIDIVIDSLYQNKGYGTLLLNYLINSLNNIKNITLEVNTNNKSAIQFYKKNGFKIAATRKNYYNDGDGYLMLKELR